MSDDSPEYADFWLGMTKPEHWLKKCRWTRRAAEVTWADFTSRNDPSETVFDTHDVSASALMLLGYAIEGAAKGLIALNRPLDWETKLKLSWDGNGHNLRALVESTQGDLDEHLADCVDRLAVYVVWYGRYPTPLGAKGDGVMQNLVIDTEIWEPSSKLYESLATTLQSALDVDVSLTPWETP